MDILILYHLIMRKLEPNKFTPLEGVDKWLYDAVINTEIMTIEGKIDSIVKWEIEATKNQWELMELMANVVEKGRIILKEYKY